MANVTKDRNTIQKASRIWLAQQVLNATGGLRYYAGTMIAADANARGVKPSGANAALKVAGVMKLHVDNTSGANDAVKLELMTGEFKFAKSGVNTPTAASVGAIGYAEDDQTIGTLNTAGSYAGIITQVDTDGVWVNVGMQFAKQ